MVKYTDNKDALFGSSSGTSGGGGPKHKKSAAANRDALFGDSKAAASTKTPSNRPSSSSSSRPTEPVTKAEPSRGYQRRETPSSSVRRPALTGEKAAEKIKEAEDYKSKANKAMQSSFFSKPDPVAASTYYKRAAECYSQAGDYKQERFNRLSSGQCNFMIKAWASAAQDYTRAAELILEETDGDAKHNRQEAHNYHKKAAEAWTQMNEKSKAAKSHVLAALALNHGEQGTLLSKDALAGMEEAIEAHVPDPLNPHVRYRQTGHSAFLDPDSDETAEKPTAETLALCQEHMVNRAYAHEPLQDLIYMLVGFGEYASALYAAGAAAAILEADGISTLTLSRVYVTESILQLAMGDPIAAEQEFLKRHVQKTAYLNSRECKLAEDLFRAVKMRDAEALEEARSPAGSNKTALANLDGSMRTLVQQIRLSGVARKVVEDLASKKESDKTKSKKSSSSSKPKTSSSSSAVSKPSSSVEKSDEPPEPAAPTLNEILNMKTGYEAEAQEGANSDPGALDQELDALDFGGDEEDDLEDDDIDLR